VITVQASDRRSVRTASRCRRLRGDAPDPPQNVDDIERSPAVEHRVGVDTQREERRGQVGVMKSLSGERR
jgi:hypothetical protein